MSGFDKWAVTVLRENRSITVHSADTQAEAEAWIMRDPLPLAQARTCYIFIPLQTHARRGQGYSRHRVTGKWRRGVDEYMVINADQRIVAGFEDAHAAIAFREEREPSRFAWSVVTSGQAQLAGLRWDDEPVTREHTTAQGARVVVTWRPDSREVWLRVIEHDAESTEGYAEMYMPEDAWRAIAGLIPAKGA